MEHTHTYTHTNHTCSPRLGESCALVSVDVCFHFIKGFRAIQNGVTAAPAPATAAVAVAVARACSFTPAVRNPGDEAQTLRQNAR